MFAQTLTEEQLKQLNESELYILRYINANAEEVMNSGIRELAEEILYSTATIIRFCKKLNLSGFSELKYAIKQNSIATQTNLINHSNAELTKNMNDFAQEIRNTLSLVSSETLDRTVTELMSYKNVHLFGTGISGIVIDYIERLLFAIGKHNVYRYHSSMLIDHAITNMNENDILIVMSSSGKFSPLIKTVKLAKLVNVLVIAISPFTKNEISNTADINFHFFADKRENTGAEYTSRLPVFYIIDLIFSVMFERIRFQEKEQSNA